MFVRSIARYLVLDFFIKLFRFVALNYNLVIFETTKPWTTKSSRFVQFFVRNSAVLAFSIFRWTMKASKKTLCSWTLRWSCLIMALFCMPESDYVVLVLEIGQEIDSMLEKVEKLDALKSRLVEKASRLSRTQANFHCANSKQKWGSVLSLLVKANHV